MSDLDFRVGNYQFPKRVYGQYLADNTLCGSLVGKQPTGFFRPKIVFDCPDPYLYAKFVSVQSAKAAVTVIEIEKIELDIVY